MSETFELKDINEESIFLKKIIDKSNESFFVTNYNGKFVYVNETACKKLGYSHKELLNFCVWDIDLLYSKKKYKDTFLNLKYDGEPFVIETLHKRKDNSVYNAEIKLSLIKFKNTDYSLGVACDVTEKEMQKKDALLAKEAAEKASQAKSIFLSNMSHELRTPMNSVLGYAELLKNTNLDEEQLSYVKELIESGSYMLQLINDILDISKIEAGKLELHKSDFSLYDLINFINNNFKAEAKKKAIELIIEHNLPEVIFINADKAKLFQVLLNLVGNAIKFTKKGFVKILIHKNDNNSYYFEVSDSGVGIDESELNQIFQIFYKSKDTSYQGTGLGLPICKKNIELMNGFLNVESKKHFGSKFYFSIILAPSLEIKNKEVQILCHYNNKTILIVDDETKNVDILKMLFAKKGFITYQANNGLKAIEIYKNKKPDVVLMDMVMPEMNGVESAKIIKKYDLKAKIIGMTASVLNSIPKNNNLFNEVIFKPLKFSELIDKVLFLLQEESDKEIVNDNMCKSIDENIKIKILENALVGNFTKLKTLIESVNSNDCRKYLTLLLNKFEIETIINKFKTSY